MPQIFTLVICVPLILNPDMPPLAGSRQTLELGDFETYFNRRRKYGWRGAGGMLNFYSGCF